MRSDRRGQPADRVRRDPARQGPRTVVAAGAAARRPLGRSPGIEVVDATCPTVQWQGELARHRFDWLFAITHLSMLPDAVLDLPTKGARQLPRRAAAEVRRPQHSGVGAAPRRDRVRDHVARRSRRASTKATCSSNGCSRSLDAETSLSLNTRNFEAAIETFDELVDELATGTETRTPQDLAAERYTFTRSDRPDAFAVLDWRQPAEVLERTDSRPRLRPLPQPDRLRQALARSAAAVLVDGRRARRDDLDDLTDRSWHRRQRWPDDIVVSTATGRSR